MEYLLNPYGLGCISTQLRGNTFSVMHSTQQKTCRAEPANPDLKVDGHSSGVWCSTYRLGSRPLHHHMHASPGSPAMLSQQWSKTKRTASLLLSSWMAICRIGINASGPFLIGESKSKKLTSTQLTHGALYNAQKYSSLKVTQFCFSILEQQLREKKKN